MITNHHFTERREYFLFLQPGNEDYLSYYTYQDGWTPTKTIGAIGALSASPGPAIVYLPTTVGNKYLRYF